MFSRLRNSNVTRISLAEIMGIVIILGSEYVLDLSQTAGFINLRHFDLAANYFSGGNSARFSFMAS
jgi:hypothetical protein